LVEPALLRWPPSRTLIAPDVQSWIFSNLFQKTNITSPPPQTYQQRILKTLIGKLEAAVEDPEEDVRLLFPLRYTSYPLFSFPSSFTIRHGPQPYDLLGELVIGTKAEGFFSLQQGFAAIVVPVINLLRILLHYCSTTYLSHYSTVLTASVSNT
jgi:hypothetical protein